MHGRTLKRHTPWAAALAALITVVTAAPAHAAVATISFNPLAGEFPEGIAIDHHGNTFVSLRTEVREVAADGTQRTIATLVPAGEGIGLGGMAFDGPGDLFVTAVTFNPADSGVYEIAPGGKPSRLPGSEQIGLANGLAFDDRGSLYVTDSLQGAVWRLNPNAPPERLVQDPLLEGDGSFGIGVPLGANGIAFRHGSLWVTNTELGRVLRIQLSSTGTAGAVQLVAESPQLIGSDGCQFDVHGNLYIALNVQSKLVRLAPNGTLTTVATAADGLDFPASPLFGEGRGDRETVFVTDFALGHANPADAHPGVVAFNVGVAGEPLPRTGGF